MAYLDFGGNGKYSIAILIKDSAISKKHIENFYINPLGEMGVPKEEIVVIGIPYDSKDKVSVATIKSFMKSIHETLDAVGVKYIMIADSKYFVACTSNKKVGNSHGYFFNCTIPGMEQYEITLGIAYGAIYYNIPRQEKLTFCLEFLAKKYNNTYCLPNNIIQVNNQNLDTQQDIEAKLNETLKYPEISLDIETEGFDVNRHNIISVAIATDVDTCFSFLLKNFNTNTNRYVYTYQKRIKALMDFLTQYEGEVYYHNFSFDIKFLVKSYLYYYFNDNFLYGYTSKFCKDDSIADEYYNLQDHYAYLLTRNAHCTKILTYLATNNCTENVLDLKSNAQEAYGKWEEDVKNATSIPTPQLLIYNGIDACATLWLARKMNPIVDKDNQRDVYNRMYKATFQDMVNMELNGLVLSAPTVLISLSRVKKEIASMKSDLRDQESVKLVTESLRLRKKLVDDSKLKTKERKLEELKWLEFNPASNQHLIELIYHLWEEPVEDKTDKGTPSTKGKVLTKILNKYKTKAPNKYKNRIEILQNIIEIGLSEKIANTFLRRFHQSNYPAINYLKPGTTTLQNYHLLCGNFNLTGTKSGRLSSNDPNLTNIPSGAKLAPLVKECITAPPGWLFVGADFKSLEDMISALTTKDPNKLKIYLEGYDSHSFRAYHYYSESMPDIDPTSVESINSIKDKYPDFRQDSKTPTFLLTYQGSWLGIVEQCGFTKKKAQQVEKRYHELYIVSDQWVQDKLIQAAKDGYVTGAFGLRLRTPLLKSYGYTGNKLKIPPQAQKELRTAGNALGQSYCMLTTRAAIEFMTRVRNSRYRLDIRLVCLIHDAIYLMIREDIDVIEWVNQNLIECMEWQALPEIQHDQVRLGAELMIYYPNWNHSLKLPNNASQEQIEMHIKMHLTKI